MITLRFSRGSGLAGAIVRLATWSPFAHVGFQLADGMVLDATPEFGVSVREAVDDETTQYFTVALSWKKTEKLMQWAHAQIGKPYDWTAIYGMAIRRDLHKDDKWFCSEICFEAFHQVGHDLLRFDGHVDRITPRDLLLSSLLVPVATAQAVTE